MKKLKSFFSGMMVMALIVALAGTAAAASGTVQFNTVNVTLLNEKRTSADSDYTAADGQKVPSVLTYTDAAGKTTHYLPVPILTELMDIPITWNAKQSILMIAGDPDTIEGKTSARVGGRTANPAEPELGATAGPFTEVSPKVVDTAKEPVGIVEENTKVQTDTGFTISGVFMAEDGKYVVLTITNNGKNAVTCRAGRARTLNGYERFPAVDIAPGKTLTRAFSIADGAEELQSVFSCTIMSTSSFAKADVTVSLMQYQ